MWQNQSRKASFTESIKALEADIQHANTLAAALPRDYGGDCIQMRLSYSAFAPLFLFLFEWMEYNCTDTLPSYLGLLHILVYKVYVGGMPTMSSKERKATLREFYSVIYPSLRQLEGVFLELKDEVPSRNKGEDTRKVLANDLDSEDECGICMENCTRMVLPNCGHSMCIICFHDWNVRSQSCPFCRGNLKRVSSTDLWVLTSNTDVVDKFTLSKQNLAQFYLFLENLPLLTPETHFIVIDYMI